MLKHSGKWLGISMAVVLPLASILAFQNCGSGFAAMTSVGSSVGGSGAVEQPADLKNLAPVTSGEFFSSQATQLAPIGKAVFLRGFGGQSNLSVSVTGLAPSTAYSVRAHLQSCSKGAGPEFSVDGSSIVGAANGIRSTLKTDATGAANATAKLQGVTGTGATSIVIHGPLNDENVACADLSPTGQSPGQNIEPSSVLGGAVNYFNFSSHPTGPIGFAALSHLGVGKWNLHYAIPYVIDNGGSNTTFALVAQPDIVSCAERAAEMYDAKPIQRPLPQSSPSFTVSNGAAAYGSIHFQSDPMLNYVSLVVTTSPGNQLFACEDFKGTNIFIPVGPEVGGVGGKFIPFIASYTIQGTATMSRKSDFSTEFKIAIHLRPALSAVPNFPTTLMAHLHNKPCRDGAGGHYLVDPALPSGQLNEVWFTLSPNTQHDAEQSLTLPLPMRADALSIVIHDPETGSKATCADLL